MRTTTPRVVVFSLLAAYATFFVACPDNLPPPLEVEGKVTTFAGTAGTSGSANGTGIAALFNAPYGIASDGTNLYVADTSNHTIRMIVIATGAVTTLAGKAGTSGSADGTGSAARFNQPVGIATDGKNLYVSDTLNDTVRRIVISTGVVTTLAGAAGAYGNTDGTGSAARFNYPKGIVVDNSDLYLVDGNQTVRRIDISTGAVTTIAGAAGVIGNSDGTSSEARFRNPYGITTDGFSLYVADTNNHSIRKIDIASGVVTTLAGSLVSGSDDGKASAARFSYPYGITTDYTNLYVADTFNHTIRAIVISTGLVTTIAGSAGIPGDTDGTGSAARFYSPCGITTDGTSLYVADTNNHTIRRIK